MNNLKDALRHTLRTSGRMLDMLASDLSPQEMLHRPCAEANCAAWIVGHLILTERQGLMILGVAPDQMPRLPDGEFEKRFARDEEGPRRGEYGDVSLLVPLFDEHRSMLLAALDQAEDARLAEQLAKPHPVARTVGEMVNFLGVHVAMHAGHLSTIRRTLGRPPVV